jgi:hypothetical protein
MGKSIGRRIGEAFEGESTFNGEDDLASLEQAFEAAAAEAAAVTKRSIESGDVDPDKAYETSYDAQIQVVVREHNQHVKTYRVRITPGG